jgi:hypothetical protein
LEQFRHRESAPLRRRATGCTPSARYCSLHPASKSSAWTRSHQPFRQLCSGATGCRGSSSAPAQRPLSYCLRQCAIALTLPLLYPSS